MIGSDKVSVDKVLTNGRGVVCKQRRGEPGKNLDDRENNNN